MRHRVSWLILVVVASLVLTWLTSPIAPRAQDGSTDLAATPCKITARPATVGDPKIRFVASVTFGTRYASKMRYSAKMPAYTSDTTVAFLAMPSGRFVRSVPLHGSFRVDLDVPVGTTHIGVLLITGGTIDPTTDRDARDVIGRYPIDKKTYTSVTWLVPPSARAYTEPSPTPRY